MIRLKSYFLFSILFLTLFRLVLSHENMAVLCFSNDGHFSIREAQHSLCENSHPDSELSEIELHDHDHCSDVEIPSISAKINSIKILEHFIYEPGPKLSFVLRFRNAFFENIPKVESKVDHGRQKRLNIISKTVLIC